MVQKTILAEAVEHLLKGYKAKIERYSIKDFLKSDVDPFRFGFNVELWGLEQAVRKEVEHKIEMGLEDLFGEFHEHYLGNAVHVPSGTKWKTLTKGSVPGVDIANQKKNWNLQIKSKHNSLNSSSADKLVQQLGALSKRQQNGIFGCGWVIAGSKKKCNGEKKIANVAKVYKGKQLFHFVTGSLDEMDSVVDYFPKMLKEARNETDFEDLKKQATRRVLKELESRAREKKLTVIKFLYEEAVK